MATSRKPSKPRAVALPMPTSERQSVRIEKIENGYLAHHSTDDPKKGYQTKTVFHPEKPQLTVEVAPAPAKKGSKK